MRFRSMQWMLARYVAVLVLVVPATAAFGQQQSQSASHLAPDGHPDISGVWRSNPGGDTYDLTGHAPRPDVGLQGDGTAKPPAHRVVGTADGSIPYQPWAAAKRKMVNVDDPSRPEDVDTQARCLLEGPGRVFIHSGFQILQAPGYVLFFTEDNDETRIVGLDGATHLGPDIKLWQGDSRGHWEGKTLVIDVTNLKAKSRLDMIGNFYSPAAHFVERLKVVDDHTIEYEATITDPTVYTQPWKLTAKFVRRFPSDAGYEIYEHACHEGERTADQLVVSSAGENGGASATPSKK